MSGSIEKRLSGMFEKDRIVFWYDRELELRDEFEELMIPGVNKLVIDNNEFGIKYTVLREKTDDKFLLYHEGPEPEDIRNWLLDIKLANGVFHTDQVSIWLDELGLGSEFTDVLQGHVEFFNAGKRREALMKSLPRTVSEKKLKLNMLGVCASAEPSINDVLESLLEELSEEKDSKFRLIERCGLDRFLWGQMEALFGYSSDKPGVRDFAIELFKSCWAMGAGDTPRLYDEALIFLNRWKNNRKRYESFEKLSSEYSSLLSIEKDLVGMDYLNLVDLDYFEVIDRKILSELVGQVTDETISAEDCAEIVRKRRQTHWYENYRHSYEAADCASEFLQKMNNISLEVESASQGVKAYAETWFRIDQLYRKFICYLNQSGHRTLLGTLYEKIENIYNNNFLLKLNNNWQRVVDSMDKWSASGVKSQREFYEKRVWPYLADEKKIFVVISDAMRYEVGEELAGRITGEDRFNAETEPVLGMLPSFTQLGMGALLPNRKLEIVDDRSGKVLVNGLDSQGSVNRGKILKKELDQRSLVMPADDFLKMNNDDARELIRDNDIIYFYHNRIDAAGDRKTETKIFEAVEKTVEELMLMIRRLTSANANNILITSDHGFIYQDREIDLSDFTEPVHREEDVFVWDRRYIIGRNLSDHPSLRKFSAKELGLEGDLEVQIPKSINRLRQKGSGSRYVHGGASLQEVVLPVIHVNKKRKSDISTVGVDILGEPNRVISSGQHTVVFYQTEPVGGKKKPIELHAGFYNADGDLISEEHKLVFNYESENPRDREKKVRFIFSRDSEKAKDQEIVLKLQEQIADTSHMKDYKTAHYQFRRSFTSDFDF
ncbi:MAG: BREX-1 system phosphatase PglZ type A [Candidatus Krumholzibacteriota bacterium]|nr:BREX-1 system phosphatase PglZ type A [Candidatus Krumholzibacteriota bacterium]